MKIYVIRHGQTDVNLENKINALNDDDLNETGIMQAKEVGKKLENIDYDFIISSPLIENIDEDDWWNLNPKQDYKDAETVKNVLDRIYDFLEELKKEYKDKIIILVTHGGTSKVINCYFKGIPENGIIRKYGHDNCEIHEFEL